MYVFCLSFPISLVTFATMHMFAFAVRFLSLLPIISLSLYDLTIEVRIHKHNNEHFLWQSNRNINAENENQQNHHRFFIKHTELK